MTITLTAWLLTTTAIGGVLALSRARMIAAVAFIGLAPLTFQLSHLPLSHPSSESPQAGRYSVLGASIVPDVAIYVLLGTETGEPRYYKFPYSESDATDLQGALDLQIDGNGNGIAAEIGDSGEAAFHAPPVTENETKAPERAVIGG